MKLSPILAFWRARFVISPGNGVRIENVTAVPNLKAANS